jgi:hypothetical protein
MVGGSVSRVLSGAVTTVGTGFDSPWGMLYDGDNIWVTDSGDNQLKKLNSDITTAASISVDRPEQPVFDGTNIWVPNGSSNTITVVRVKDTAGNPLATPFVLATLAGNGLNIPWNAAFDGQRILVVNLGGQSVSLWKATDLTPLGSVLTGGTPQQACSCGVNFWIVLYFDQLLRF